MDDRTATPTDLRPITADDFLANTAQTGGFPPVLVPGVEIGGKPVFVAKITAVQLAEFYDEVKDVPDAEDRLATLMYCVRRPDNSRLFKPSDRVRYTGFDADLLVKITRHFMQINGMQRGN